MRLPRGEANSPISEAGFAGQARFSFCCEDCVHGRGVPGLAREAADEGKQQGRVAAAVVTQVDADGARLFVFDFAEHLARPGLGLT